MVLFILWHVISFIFGRCTSCPSCHESWAEELQRTVLLEESNIYSKDVKTDDGYVMKAFQRKKYKKYYRCKKCGYEWSTISTSEVEV